MRTTFFRSENFYFRLGGTRPMGLFLSTYPSGLIFEA